MSKRAELLNKAINIVDGERKDRYGEPEDVFTTIALMWSDYCNQEITALDVANMMMLLKIARSRSNPEYQDNYIDIAGYAACAGEIAAEVDEVDEVDNRCPLNRLLDVFGEERKED